MKNFLMILSICSMFVLTSCAHYGKNCGSGCKDKAEHSCCKKDAAAEGKDCDKKMCPHGKSCADKKECPHGKDCAGKSDCKDKKEGCDLKNEPKAEAPKDAPKK